VVAFCGADGDYGIKACIETVKIALAEEKVKHGAVVALIQGGVKHGPATIILGEM